MEKKKPFLTGAMIILDLHCLQRQCISGFSRTRVKYCIVKFRRLQWIHTNVHINGSIVYNRAIVYKRKKKKKKKKILKVDIHAIIINRALVESQVTVISSRAILVAVTSECC